ERVDSQVGHAIPVEVAEGSERGSERVETGERVVCESARPRADLLEGLDGPVLAQEEHVQASTRIRGADGGSAYGQVADSVAVHVPEDRLRATELVRGLEGAGAEAGEPVLDRVVLRDASSRVEREHPGDPTVLSGLRRAHDHLPRPVSVEVAQVRYAGSEETVLVQNAGEATARGTDLPVRPHGAVFVEE